MPELIPIFLFMAFAAVLILRPISKKLGVLIEAMARERSAPAATPERGLTDAQVERITSVLERMGARLDLIEDRLEFTERLVDASASERRLHASS